MNELDYRRLMVYGETQYLGIKTNDDAQRFLVDVYNEIRPLPRGIKMAYGVSWCAGFQSAFAQIYRFTDIIPVEQGCYEMMKTAKAMGIWHSREYRPQVGDLVLFDWEKNGKRDGVPDHVELVEATTDSAITVIGGNNTGGMCSRQSYLLTDPSILGYIAPDYASKVDGKPASNFPWIGVVQTTVNLRTSPQNRGPFNYCNIEAPTGTKIRHQLVPGEKVKVIGESGNWWQVEINGRYTWTPFLVKSNNGRDILIRE